MQGPGQIGRIANNIGRGCHRSRARTWRDLDAALHPGFTMARHRTEIGELAGPVRGERYDAARASANDPVRAYGVLVEDDVVLGAFAVDQVDLHSLAFVHVERGIDFAVDVAADAQKNHPALGDAGTQRENGWGMHVAMGRDAGRGSGASRGRRRRLRLQVQRCRLGRWRRMLVLLGPDRRWVTNQACGKDRPADVERG